MRKIYFFPNLKALVFEERSINILHSTLTLIKKNIIHLLTKVNNYWWQEDKTSENNIIYLS